jgi:hypothetical protein
MSAMKKTQAYFDLIGLNWVNLFALILQVSEE